MKKTLKGLTVGTLLVTMALGMYGAASAESTNEAAIPKAGAVVAVAAPGKSFVVFHHGPSLLQNPVLERNYLLMLANAYAPGSVDEWKKAFEERKQAESEMPKPPIFDKKLPLPKDLPFGEGKLEMSTGVPPAGLEAGGKLRVELKKGEVNEIMEPGKPKDDIIKKELSEAMLLEDDFAKAVEAGDDAAIKQLMPKLLEAYKKQTADLKIFAEKIKKAVESETKDKAAQN